MLPLGLLNDSGHVGWAGPAVSYNLLVGAAPGVLCFT